MEVYKGNEVWELDEGLRNTAQELLAKFPDELGHIELDRVVFVRANGVKLSKTNTNWYGKCFLVKVPMKILPHFVMLKLGTRGCWIWKTYRDLMICSIFRTLWQ